MSFSDTHVHFHFPDFDPDRAEAIRRAREAGFELFINVGTDVESSKKSLELAEANPDIYATAGIHPHDAKEADASAFEALEELLKKPRMVAIGEVGLDFFRDHSPRETQRQVFRRFIEMQSRVCKPLVVHCRDAYEEVISLFKETAQPPYAGVMHCYSSDRAMMVRFLDLGFYISFAGPLTYKKNEALREACAACPSDRLLFETDAPFLPPQDHRGRRNEPFYMLQTLELASQLKKMTVQALGDRTSLNARKLFNL